MQTETNLKQIIAANINYLMSLFCISRKQLCEKLDIKYTTLCDWLGAKSYPRIDTLESLASFFSINVQDFFVEIESNENLVARISEYARRFIMKNDYRDTYPEGFFDLFGILSDSDMSEPEDLNAEEMEITF